MNHYVYMITNNINGMKYIGKRSCNGDIEKDSYMGGGTKLKEAQKEYGINNFTKTVLALAFDEAMAFELENYYIKKADAVESDKYYNETYGGTGSSMFYHEDPERRKRVRQILSEKNKGTNAGENSKVARKVICVNNKKIFVSLADASKSIGKSRGYLSGKCDGYTTGNYGGFDESTGEPLFWMYYDNYLDYTKKNGIEPVPLYDKRKDKRIICINSGKIYWTKEFVSKKFNIYEGSLKTACHKKNYSYGAGFDKESNMLLEWMYYLDYLEMTKCKNIDIHNTKVICLNNNVIYDSIKIASKELKTPMRDILECCFNEKPSRRFKYKETGESYRWHFYNENTKDSNFN